MTVIPPPPFPPSIRPLSSGNLHRYQWPGISLGFSECGVEIQEIRQELGGYDMVELTQTHSTIIRFASSVSSPQNKGDGIILNRRGQLAVIHTADCIPLFFHSFDEGPAGIVHCGWRGLAGDIELKLLQILSRGFPLPLSSYRFLLGPAICPACYPVQKSLMNRFRDSRIRSRIFTPSRNRGEVYLDLKQKLFLSLSGKGIPPDHIHSLPICTLSDPRFCSHRRSPEKAGRIHNVILRRPVSGTGHRDESGRK